MLAWILFPEFPINAFFEVAKITPTGSFVDWDDSNDEDWVVLDDILFWPPKVLRHGASCLLLLVPNTFLLSKKKLECMKSVEQIYDVNIEILLQPHDVTLGSMNDLRKSWRSIHLKECQITDLDDIRIRKHFIRRFNLIPHSQKINFRFYHWFAEDIEIRCRNGSCGVLDQPRVPPRFPVSRAPAGSLSVMRHMLLLYRQGKAVGRGCEFQTLLMDGWGG